MSGFSTPTLIQKLLKMMKKTDGVFTSLGAFYKRSDQF